MPKRYPTRYKQKVIQDCQNGIPIYEVSQISGIAISTIYRWLKEWENEISVPNYSALLHKKERLEHILDVIRLSGLIDEVPLHKRLDILETLHT